MEKLTPREQEVADLVAQGLTSHKIATKLGVTKFTVDKHRKSLCHKYSIKRDQLKYKLKEITDGLNK